MKNYSHFLKGYSETGPVRAFNRRMRKNAIRAAQSDLNVRFKGQFGEELADLFVRVCVDHCLSTEEGSCLNMPLAGPRSELMYIGSAATSTHDRGFYNYEPIAYQAFVNWPEEWFAKGYSAFGLSTI